MKSSITRATVSWSSEMGLGTKESLISRESSREMAFFTILTVILAILAVGKAIHFMGLGFFTTNTLRRTVRKRLLTGSLSYKKSIGFTMRGSSAWTGKKALELCTWSTGTNLVGVSKMTPLRALGAFTIQSSKRTSMGFGWTMLSNTDILITLMIQLSQSLFSDNLNN